MEHLAHVIFGFEDFVLKFPTMKQICDNFSPNCPSSPCKPQ